MKTFLQCALIFACISSSNSDELQKGCSALQFLSNSFLDVTASNSATGQDVYMMAEKTDTNRDRCLEACCDRINDGCTVAIFSEIDAKCYLYHCSPVDRCVVSSSANNTTIFIGLAATTPTQPKLTTESKQASTAIPLSETTEAAKLSNTDQDARTTSTPGKAIEYLTDSTPSLPGSPETITTKKQDLTEAAQKTEYTLGQLTANVNQMAESQNNIPKASSSIPMQQGSENVTIANEKSSEKNSLPPATVGHETTPDNSKQTSSTKGPATLATLSTTVTPELQIPTPIRSTLNGLTTESATSKIAAGTTATVSKTEESFRTTQAAKTPDSTSVTKNVNGVTTEKVSTDNSTRTETNTARKTDIESNTPTSRTTSSYVTLTSTPLTINVSTTPGEEQKHITVTTPNNQKIQASGLTLINQTDQVSFTENIQIQSGTISVTNITSTLNTSADELIKELYQLNNTMTPQSNTSEQIVIDKQGADHNKMNSTLPIPMIDFSEDMVVSGALIAALSFGILFFFAMLVLVCRRCFEGWKRRHYSRIDYLVNGMYN